MTRSIFAAYRGDEFVDVGTAEELSESLGLTFATVYSMATPSHHRKNRGSRGGVMIYRIGEERE